MPYTAAQLTQFFRNVNLGQAPDPAATAAINTAASQNAAGQISDAQALNVVLDGAQIRATTDVAVTSYQFYISSIPSAAGVNFLVNNPGTGYNTAFYNGQGGTATAPGPGGFNLENRYFNASLNLGANPAGQSFNSFVANYGSVSLQNTINVAYESIVGVAAVGQSQFNAAVAAINGAIPYFTRVAAERAPQFNQDLAVKAVVIGYILQEAVKADVGNYARALDNFNAALAIGTAQFGTNLITTYGPNGPGANTGVGSAGVLNNGAALANGSTVPAPAGATIVTSGVAAGGSATLGANSGTTIVLGDVATNNGQLFITVPNATAGGNTTDTLSFAYRNVSVSTVSSVVADGVETINVDVRNGAGANAMTTLSFDLSDAALTTLNITGDGSVTFFAGTYANVVGGQLVPNGGALRTVNASGATGPANIDVTSTTGTGTAPISVAGGSAADTIAFKDATLVTGGAGGDMFNVFPSTSGTTFSSISDRGAGDAFIFRGAAGGVSRVTSFNGTPIVPTSGSGYQASLDAASNGTLGSVATFNFNGDTFLVQDNSAGASTFQAGVDIVVRLVGVQNLAGSTVGSGTMQGVLITS